MSTRMIFAAFLVGLLAAACAADDDADPTGNPSSDTGAQTDAGSSADTSSSNDTGGGEDSSPGHDPGAPSDSGAEHDPGASSDSGAEDGSGATGPPLPSDGPLESVVSIHWTWGFEFFAGPSQDTDQHFAHARFWQQALQLEPDTCALLDSEYMQVPARAPTLDAGTVTLAATWAQWGGGTGEVVSTYEEKIGNYTAVIAFEANNGYEPEHEMTLSAPGGADLEAFTASVATPPDLKILLPAHPDEGGSAPPALTEPTPVTVEWEAGTDSETLQILMTSEWVMKAYRKSFLACNVVNDGAFTIPAEALQGFEWGSQTDLALYEIGSVPLYDPPARFAWTFGTADQVRVHEDLDAQVPPPDQAPGIVMQEDFVGEACTLDAECGGGQCLTGVMFFPDRYCSVAECLSDADCPQDAVCHVAVHLSSPYYSFCAKKCAAGSDCREPFYMCKDESEGKVCLPAFF
jgi:hypothetical protein